MEHHHHKNRSSTTIKRALDWRADYYFNWAEAKRAIRFFERELVHVKGELAGQRIKLEPWQRRVIKRTFGWFNRSNDLRKHKIVWVEVGRKNGKSTIASGAGCFMLFADREPGAEVVSAAGDVEQAAIVFDVMRAMVEKNPNMSALARTYKRTIVVPKTASKFNVLSAEAYSKHGKNLSGIIVDEVHVQPNADLIDTLLTARGSRRQPLVFMLTTAGSSRNSVCWDYHQYACDIRDGIIEDPTFLPFIYAADPEDDWTKEETWKKANPNYGISIKPEFLAEECKKAQNSPRYENTFKRLYLNLWTSQDVRWLPMHIWDIAPDLKPESELVGVPCFAGLDLSTRQDISCLCLVFVLNDGTVQLMPRFYCPEENIAERSKRDRVPYEVWVKQGLLVATPGNVIDYAFIERDALALYQKFGVNEFAIDPWNAVQFATRMQHEGLPVIFSRQGYGTMSSPSKEFEAMVINQKIRHGGHPILRWMASNVAVETDPAGNIKPSKKKSTERIDGIVAGIMGIDRALRNKHFQSIYETQGLTIL